jgi:alkaline phosphatase
MLASASATSREIARMSHRRLDATLLVFASLLVIPAPSLAAAKGARPAARSASPAARPRNAILMIPDGCGPSAIALARLCAGRPLALDSILVGAASTRSATERITDSAASATALATGVKTCNARISVDTLYRPLGTVLEAARARGMATGLVAMSRITHATPAAFAAHADERSSEDTIAVQMLAQGVDVMFGGGRRHFVPRTSGGSRRDGRDLLAEARARGVQVIVDRAALDGALRPPVLGLFAMDHMDYVIDGDSTSQPALSLMAARAIELLSKSPGGFFLMIEGSRIDPAAHTNDPATMVREILEYDRAVQQALEFARRDGHTLVVSVADHETGGVSPGRGFGETSVSDVRPEALARVSCSAERMARLMLAGARPDSLLRVRAGVDSLGPGEEAMLRDGVAGRAELDLAIGEIESRRALVGWTTEGHTACDVGLYAFGPGRERFAGLHDNTDVGRAIAELLGLDLAAVTARLRESTPVLPRNHGAR